MDLGCEREITLKLIEHRQRVHAVDLLPLKEVVNPAKIRLAILPPDSVDDGIDELPWQTNLGHLLHPRTASVSFDPVESKPLAATAITAAFASGITRSHAAVRPLRPAKRVRSAYGRPNLSATTWISSSTRRPAEPARTAVALLPARAASRSPKL